MTQSLDMVYKLMKNVSKFIDSVYSISNTNFKPIFNFKLMFNIKFMLNIIVSRLCLLTKSLSYIFELIAYSNHLQLNVFQIILVILNRFIQKIIIKSY